MSYSAAVRYRVFLLLFSFKLTAQTPAGNSDRDFWLSQLDRLARPILWNLANDRLRTALPSTLSKRTDNAESRALAASELLLPLGLPATDAFWSAPPELWTSQKIWRGLATPGDHSID